MLARRFVQRYASREGAAVVGRVIPFGIGAIVGGSMNYVASTAIIKAADKAFGPPPAAWPRPGA
jgi:hypothetical protein